MLQKRYNSFRYAFAGITRLFKSQPNARIHLIAVVLVVFSGFYFHVSAIEWCLLILAMSVVLAAEGFNTALEFFTDLVSPDFHPNAGRAKDIAAGAVLITAIGALIIGVIIFLPRIQNLLSN